MSEPRYLINVSWSSVDYCWIAYLSDLKPCSAHGDTPSFAVAEAQVTIGLWLEIAREHGLAIPEPRYRPAIYAAA